MATSKPPPGTEWTVQDWNNLWQSGSEIEWESTEVDKRLLKYEDKLLGGREKHKMFFPLCGNSFDMKWAYDKGFEVVGVDCVDASLVKFFEVNGIPYTETKMDVIKGTLFKSQDERIRLYGCDVQHFKSDLEPDCTAIWDSAAIVALSTDLVASYCRLMKEMMAADGRYIIFTFDFDESKAPGPPHSIPMDRIKEFMGAEFSYELLERSDMLENMRDEGCRDQDGGGGTQQGEDDMSQLDFMWGNYTLISRK